MEEDQISKFKENYYPAKFASKKNGVVYTYAANTHSGMVRTNNEDRVSIILNIIQPKNKQVDFWPRCSYFSIYDGHGGVSCADFLRDQLHQQIVKDRSFPQNPKIAIRNGIKSVE
jgi:protein phosphatase PTC2/3